MLKRTLAWVLTLALLLSVMPQMSLRVTAEEVTTPPAAHSHAAAQHNCEHCDETITWTAWEKTNSLPTGSGHYYLTGDVKPTAQTKLTGTTDLVLCLNGYTISGESYNGSLLYVQDTAKLTISDCTAYTDESGVFHAGTIKNCKAGGAMSGAIYAKHNCAVALYDCIFTGNKVNYLEKSSGDGFGGAVQLRGDKAGTASSLYMENVVFDTNTSAVSAGALNVVGTTTIPTVTVKNCTFKNNTALNGGAAYLKKTNAVFTDCVFEGNTSKGGSLSFQGTKKTLTGGTVCLNAADVTMEKCTFKDNNAIEGGAVYNNGGTLKMTDCEITGNEANYGGAVYANGGDTTMTRCTVSGNQVKKDSAGNIQSKAAVMLLDGCTVENNTGSGSAGSAFYIHGGNSNVTLKDTAVINNRHTGTNATSRAGIYVTNKTDKLTVTGKTVVDGNLVAVDGNAVECNIYMQNSPNAIDVSGLSNGASISVYTKWTATTPDFVTAATAPGKWSSAWVIYENNGMAVDYNETDKFHFVENLVHEHCVCGITGCAQTDHEKLVFQPWTGNTELPASGTYYLTENVTLDGAVSVTSELNLCLNGHTVTQSKADNRVIGVSEGGKLLITSCKAGGTVTGGNATANGGGGIYATGEGTTLALNNITVSKNTSSHVGGGIHVVTKAQATLNNVTVTDNTASTNGGGIAVREGGKLTMTGGAVTDNDSGRDGAGLYVQKDTEATVTDTEFTGNTVASGAGGGVAISGKAVLTDITIKNNTATNGAGMITQGSADATLNGGQITGNQATGNGGGIYVSKKLTLNGTSVTGNTAKTGDGVYVAATDVLTVTGNTVVKNNSATNLYLSGTCNMAFADLTDKAYVSVSVKNNTARAITGQTSQDPTAHLHSDSADLVPAYREGIVYLDVAIKHIHCLCGGGGTGCDHSDVRFAKWDKKDSLPTEGAYYLENDVVLTGETSISGDLTLCLNGHTVTAAKGERIMSNPKNTVATVTISDCTAATDANGVYTAGKLTGGVDDAGTAGGGFMYVRAGGVLKIYDGIITDCTSTFQGGAICLADTTKMEMHGGEISDCAAVSADGKTWKKGGAIAAYKAELIMTGGTIKNNDATNGAISGNNGSTITITGGTICGNWSKSDGGGVYVNKSGLYISGNAVICHNISTSAGGNICYGGDSYGSVTGITLEGGEGSGAAAIIQNGAVVTFTNVTVKDNMATNATAAIRLYKATLTLDDCTITGNTAKDAAAVSVENGSKLTIKNGKISENTATSTCGGVRVDDSSSLTLAGKPVISGNAQGNLLLLGGTLMDVSAVTEGAEIWITADMGPISKPCSDVSKCFQSESTYRAVVYRDGALHMATDGSHKHCFCFGAKEGCNHTVVEWAAWESTTSLPTSGNYYLLNDVVLTEEQSVSSDVNICLNGHTVTAAENKRHISTPKGAAAHIVITDCTAKTVDGVYTAGKLTGGVDTSDNVGGGSIYIRAGGTLELYEGIITGNTSYKAGGALLFAADATFIMHGGEVSHNKAVSADGTNWKDGGAIYCIAGSHIQIHGGTIQNNEGDRGGALIYYGQGDLTITGGTFTGNKSHGQGGAIYAATTTVTITGGKIVGNTSLSTAGGLCLATKAQAVMTGGEISGNTATGCGGVAIQGGAVLDLQGGQIVKNTSTGTGGGMGIYSKAMLTMTGGTIAGNTSGKNGAGIYIYQAGAAINGGSVSNNTGGRDGGGIYIREGNLDIADKAVISGNKITSGSGGGISYGTDSTGKITGGTIEKNVSVKGGAGGVIIQNNASVEITDVTVRNNTALNAGGGIWAYKSTLKISGGTFQGNKSTKSNGGGIAATSKSVFTMTGGTVKGNSAKTTGGGISSNNCNATISGITVTGNTCEKDGAGIYNTVGKMNISGKVVVTGNSTKANGGGVCYGSKSSGYISGLSVYGNTAKGGGGGMIIQNNANVTIGYAYIADNEATKTGGGIFLYKAGLTMTGGTITNNTAKGSGGGIYATDATVLQLTNVTITKNTAKSGGGLYGMRSKAIVKDSEISYNTTTGSGTGYYTSGGTWKAAMAGGEFTNVKIIGNHGGTGCSGAAAYINVDVEVTFTNCQIADNISDNYGGGIYAAAGAVPTMTGCTITGNEAVRNGGGLLIRDCGYLTDCVFSGNKADKGAGIFAGNYTELYHVNGFGSKGDDIGLFMTNCEITDNEAVTDGGGLHLNMSCYTTIDDCTFTGNKAGVCGSAMWLWENCTMTDLTVTGNVCANNGHALYLADSEFDGQTYINGLFKMGGDMIVKDNEGGDLYLDNKTTIGALAQGYGPKTYMGVTLDAGLLTQRVMGIYNYEGGDCSYILTYGDRSMTDPEYVAAAEEETEDQAEKTENTLLYAGVGVFAALIAAVAVIVVLLKKKKAGKTAKEATKE